MSLLGRLLTLWIIRSVWKGRHNPDSYLVAPPDGRDATRMLQTAIDIAARGGTVHVAAGTYNVSTTLRA